MVWPILISVSVTPGALAAHAGRKPWEEYAAAAAADCNRKRRVIMSFLLDAFVGCALRLAKIDPNEAFASNPRHITSESAVTRITLRYVSPCIRLELRRVRAELLLRRSNAIAERLAHQSISRPVALGPTRWPSGGVAWAESSHS